MKKPSIWKVCMVVMMLLLLGILTTACSKKNTSENEQMPFLEKITYSNLSDEASQDEVKKAMEKAGIDESDIEYFFDNVRSYNQVIENTGLTTGGFEESKEINPSYDIERMQELWDTKNPDFLGYNCRITSLGFMKNFVEVNNPIEIEDLQLVFDKEAIRMAPNKKLTSQEWNLFENLFSSIKTPITKDIQVHLQNVKKDWEVKQIRFKNKDQATFISVFFHFIESEEESKLFIGHIGLLLPTEDGKYLFIEKVSFIEPYQAIKFENKVQLNDYLMNKYDIEWGQASAKPFIMENDNLLEGYRPNPNNKE